MSVLDELRQAVGDEHVLTDEASCVLYSQDVYTKALPALAVARPGSAEELAAIVASVTKAGNAVIARGGGMSYTSGFVPKEAGSVIIDMSRLDEVIEINTDDMYVTVGCGVTWKSLYEALQGSGYRTPHWGTLSGIHATVGGGMSQNCIFWGSGRYGTSAESVVSLEVVLADGTIVTTGAAAQENGSPFFRYYGPDLTGLFLCDNGALGIKATATLRLVPEREHREHLSFEFDDYPDMAAAMSAIARAEIVDECFGFDPMLQAVRMQRESLMSDVKKLAGVMKAGGSALKALKEGAKVAMAGRGFMKDVRYSVHLMIESNSAAGAKANADAARQICQDANGNEIENSIPKILRANPFTPLNNMIGPNGERWVPVHTVVPHSKAEATIRAVNAVFENHKDAMETHGIGVGFLLATISTNGFVVEPVFFTPDALDEIHHHTVEDSVLNRIDGFDANPEARALTAQLRQEVIAVFAEMGGIHMQIGKSYPYRDHLQASSWQLVDSVKQAVDPERRVNPGALGLD